MSNPIGLYIHIPFCKSKCPYCDFFSNRASSAEFEHYTDLLLKKIELWADKVKESISTVYIGGGTPSIIGTDRLLTIIKCINKNFSVNTNAEFTLEVNPDSGKSLDFQLLKNAGVNRISIGLQSANKEELKILGRIHSLEDVTLTINIAKQSGIDNISLDLMMGIPNQSIESIKNSINFCSDCGVTHISSYILKIEKNTYFDRIKDKLALPNDDEQAEIYLAAVKHLETLGYQQYEISNFSKKGFESNHNTSYWKCSEYIGIGPSAYSFYKGKRFHYNRNIDDFTNDIIINDEIGGNAEEFIMLSLRLKSGLNFNELYNRYGVRLSDTVIKKAKLLENAGYLKLCDDSICLTPKGFLVSNSIICELI